MKLWKKSWFYVIKYKNYVIHRYSRNVAENIAFDT
jgi:hypothetical protein